METPSPGPNGWWLSGPTRGTAQQESIRTADPAWQAVAVSAGSSDKILGVRRLNEGLMRFQQFEIPGGKGSFAYVAVVKQHW